MLRIAIMELEFPFHSTKTNAGIKVVERISMLLVD
jgi:hypothetical protein